MADPYLLSLGLAYIGGHPAGPDGKQPNVVLAATATDQLRAEMSPLTAAIRAVQSRD